MRKLNGGPCDGREVKDHVKFDRIYIEAPWLTGPIFLTSAHGRAMYVLVGENYQFDDFFVRSNTEEIKELP